MEATFDFRHAYPEILLLVGTQTGNAEIVAQAVEEMLEHYGFVVELQSMVDAEPEVLNDFSQLIVCTSTFGEGELPDMADTFHDAIRAVAPDLAHLAFGVISLGDRHYAHFANAGDIFTDTLEALGAVAILDVYRIDQGPTLDQIEAAQAWSLHCAQAFSNVFADDEE